MFVSILILEAAEKESNLLEVDFYPLSQSEGAWYPLPISHRLVGRYVASAPKEKQRTRKDQR